MDHHRSQWVSPFLSLLLAAVLETKSLWELEVELDGGTLMPALKRVLDTDIYFWAIKCPIAGVELPFSRVVSVKGLFKTLYKGI